MKKRFTKTKKFTPVSAAAAAVALATTGAQAQTSLFDATFPASWNGTGTTVTNLSGAGVGFQSGTATYTTATVPSWAAVGSGSMSLAGVGGVKVTPTASLNNSAIQSAGGFTYNVAFLWDGTDSSASFSGAEKLIDYAGTESLQLSVPSGAGSASLQMLFANDGGIETTNVSTTIAPNTWYNVTLTFDTMGNSLVGGDISGIASLYVNGSLMDSGAATKGTSGDDLGRPIGIGEFGYGHTTSIIGLYGDIYSASVDLGVAAVPEPSSTALMGAVGGLAMIWNLRRRKAKA